MVLLSATNFDGKIRDTWAEKDGRPQISYFALLARTACAALLKESRMKSISAMGLHRKSGGKPLDSFSLQDLKVPPLVPTRVGSGL
jgi:hypothetical protein